MKKFTKILCLVLLVLVLAFSVIACNEDTGNDDGGNQGGNSTKTQTYTVKYLNGDNVIYSTTVDEGETLKTYSPNAQEGYVFEGWYLDADFTESFKSGSAVNKNLTLYGKFTFKSFTVTFVDYDGTEIVSRENVPYGAKVEAPSTSALGSKFKGWDTDFSAVTKNLTVKAVYNKVTVTFLYWDGSEIFSTEVDVGSDITANADYISAVQDMADDLANSNELVFNDIVSDVELKDGKYITPEDVTFSPSVSLIAPDAPTAKLNGAQQDTFEGTYPIASGNVFEFTFTRSESAQIKYTESFTINGSAAALNNGKIDFSNFTPGAYTLTYTVTASYMDVAPVSSSKSVNITIHQGIIADEDLKASGGNYTFDGNSHTISVDVEGKNDYVVLYSDSADGQFTATKPAFTNAGTYTVYYKVTREHYQDSEVKQANVSIAKKNVTVYANKPSDVHFGAPRPAFSYHADIDNFTGVQVTYDCTYIPGKATGTYTVTPKTLEGTEQQGNTPNYNISYEGTSFEVTARPVTVSVTGNKVYDGDNWQGDVSISGLATNYKAQGNYKTKSVKNGNYTSGDDFEANVPVLITDANGSDVTDQHDLSFEYNVTISIGEFPVTAIGSTKEYNDIDYYIDAVTSSVKGYSVLYSLDDINYDSDIPGIKNAGDHKVYYKVIDANSVLDPANGYVILKITKKDVTVTANNENVVYGNSAPEFSASYTLLGGDTLSSLTFNCDYVEGSHVGAYAITPVGTADNYNIIPANGTLTVAPRPVTITANDLSITYGDQAPASSAYSLKDCTLYGSDSISVSFTSNYAKGNNAGSYAIVPSATHSDYDFTFVNGTLTVNKKSATVNANDAGVTYGNSAPIYGYTAKGLESGDSITVNYSCDYSKGKDIGTYQITPVVDAHQNYSFSCVNGTLTVNKRSLTISIEATAYYDTSVWSKTITSVSGLLDNERPQGTVTIPETTSGDGTVAGTYANASQFSWTNEFKILKYGKDSTDNYEITFTYNVTINEVDFVIGAHDLILTYDGELHTPQAIAVLKDGNNVTESATITYSKDGKKYDSTIPSYKEAGEYTLYYTVIYDGSNNLGTININILKKDAIVTLYDATAVYGEKAPAFTYDLTGIIEADKDNVGINLTCPSYAQGKDAGTYEINAEAYGSAKGNYFFNYANASDSDRHTASLTVTKRDVLITANSYNITYGDATPEYGASYTLYGDDSVDITYTSDYIPGSNVGSYDIVPYVSDTENYHFSFANGTVSVAKKAVKVTVSDYEVKYGSAKPDFVIVYTLFGDDVVAITANCSYIQGKSNVGTYPITLSVDTTAQKYANYDFTLGSATLTVSKRTLKVELDNITISYGDDYTITYNASFPNYDGIYSGDTFVPTVSNLTTNSEGKANVGTYNITFSANTNYDLNANTAKLVVNKRDVAVVWNIASNITYTGNSLTDNVSAYYSDYNNNPVSVKVIKYNGGDIFINAGDYTLEAQVSDSNYNFSNTRSSAEILKGKVTIEANQTQSYAYSGSTVSFDKTKVALSFAGAEPPKDGIALSGNYSAINAGTYKLTISYDSANLASESSVVAYLKIGGAQIGDDWYTIEDALATATSGQTVFVRTNMSFADADISEAIYTDSKYRTVKSGVILRLPSDADDSGTIGSPTYNTAQVNYYVDTNSGYIQEKLTIPAHVTLDVKGTILLNGVLGSAGTQRSGHTSGKHGQIINNGTINVASGAIVDARGFVKGTGTLTFNSGAKAYSPFVIIDFKGGSYSITVYSNEPGIAPFSQWEMPNFQCKTVFEYGSTHTAYLDLYANDSHNKAQENVIATKDSLLIMGTGSRVTTTYNRSAGVATVQMTGNVTWGSLDITVTVSSIDKTLSMSDVQFFAIPWTYNVIIGDGSTATTFNVGGNVKLMTGFNCTVEKNATVNVSGKAIIYTEFVNTTSWSDGWSLNDSGSKGYLYPTLSAAKVTVKGTLNVTGGIGGKIYGADGGKVIIGSGATLTLTSSEGDHGNGKLSFSDAFALLGNGSVGTYVETSSITETAQLISANGVATTATQGTTYTYSNSSWN